jgi:putative tryptophan/tyrosine transport system substrate-binding protein
MTGGPLAAPLAVEAQQADKVYRIGILGNVPLTDPSGESSRRAYETSATWKAVNITIENLSSDGRYERLSALAADLVRHKVDIIVAPAAQNVLAAKQATRTIAIVMVSVGDPVGNGLVASLARPGGNVTGTSFLTSAMVGKQLELLKQITPRVARLAVLLNPANPGHLLALDEAKVAARSLGVPLQAVEARDPADLERAFAAMTGERAGALFVPWDGMFLFHSVRITQLAARTRLPAMYGQRRYVDAGGLVSYGPSALESFRGATAKALGLTIPPSLLQRADQVLE